MDLQQGINIQLYLKAVGDYVDYEEAIYTFLAPSPDINKIVVHSPKAEEITILPVDTQPVEANVSKDGKPMMSPKKATLKRVKTEFTTKSCKPGSQLTKDFQCHLPSTTAKKLEEKVRLTTVEEEDLLEAVYVNITGQGLYYPKYKTLAADLIAQIPYLAESWEIGDAIQYWHDKLQVYFQNKRKRRDREVPEVKALVRGKKRGRDSTENAESPVLKSVAAGSASEQYAGKYGFRNYCPSDRPSTEDASTIMTHCKLLQTECKKRLPDKELISVIMDLTFADRRWQILKENSKISDVVSSYPALGMEEEFIKEFKRMVPPEDMDMDKGILTGFAKFGPALLKASKPARRTQMEMYVRQLAQNEYGSKNKRVLLGYAALFSLMTQLKEEPTDLISSVERESPGPYIRSASTNFLDVENFSVVVENVRIVKTNELFHALQYLFCTVYMFNLSYDPSIKKTCSFIQNYFLGIKDTSMTKQMRKLYSSLLKASIE